MENHGNHGLLPADGEQTRAECQALDPFARETDQINTSLSIVKPFKGGLRVRHWSQILTRRGQKSIGGAHLHAISTHQISLKGVTCGTDGFAARPGGSAACSSSSPPSCHQVKN